MRRSSRFFLLLTIVFGGSVASMSCTLAAQVIRPSMPGNPPRQVHGGGPLHHAVARSRWTGYADNATIAQVLSGGNFVPGIIDAPDDLTVPPFYGVPPLFPPPVPPGVNPPYPARLPMVETPRCPLIIKVGRGLKHRVPTRVLSGRHLCR